VAEPVPRAVFDTNVLISALRGYHRGPSTPPVSCLDLALLGAVQLVTSPALIVELVHALSYPKLGIPLEEAHTFGAIVTATAGPGGLVHIDGRLDILRRDPSVYVVLETALFGRATYLVTGNQADFAELGRQNGDLTFRGIRIVTPREFVEAVG
jgi:putative PIN family toxin of toxin-antitoxin system